MSNDAITPNGETRECKLCKRALPLTDFPLNGDKRGGRRHQCRECMRQVNKSWRQSNVDKVSVYNRNRRTKPGDQSEPDQPASDQGAGPIESSEV